MDVCSDVCITHSFNASTCVGKHVVAVITIIMIIKVCAREAFLYVRPVVAVAVLVQLLCVQTGGLTYFCKFWPGSQAVRHNGYKYSAGK